MGASQAAVCEVQPQSLDATPFLELAALPRPFHVFFTTRIAGTSVAPYDSLNLALHVGDDPRCVRENRRLVFDAWGLKHSTAVVAQQAHGNQVAVVDGGDVGRGVFTHLDAIPGADGLLTRAAGLPLMAFSADCLLLALGDPQARVLALLHCGWRGIASGIIENAAAALCSAGAAPERIHAVGGPCIGRCCFEVGLDVAHALGGEALAHTSSGKVMLDLRRAAVARLFNCGISEGRVALDPACTCCREDRFFSHRRATRQGFKTCGRMAMVAWMD